ncbi:MAG: hypothetical protein U1A78_27395 [Polyangia bacterium]
MHRLLEQTLVELLDTPERLAAFNRWHGLAPPPADPVHARAALREALPADELLARLRARFPDELAQRSRYRLAGAGGGQEASEHEPLIRMLPPRPQPFVGRAALLGSVRGALAQHRRVALVGPPGVGRRALGRELIARQAGEYDVVAWLRAAAPALLHADLLTLWAMLVERGRLTESPEPAARTEAARLAALLAWIEHEPRCLLVLAAPEPVGADETLERLVQRSAGPVLVCGLLKQNTSAIAEIAIPPLDLDEALALAVTISGRHRLLRGEAQAAHEVVEALGRLPAPIRLVASEVAAHGLTWLQCRDELRAQAGAPTGANTADGGSAAGASR